MRRVSTILLASIAGASAFVAPSAEAQLPPPTTVIDQVKRCSTSDFGRAVTCDVAAVVSMPAGGTGRGPGAGNGGAGDPPPFAYVSFPRMGATPEGEPCVTSEQLRFPNPPPPDQVARAAAEWQDFLSRSRSCPSTGNAADPQLIAIRASRDIPLPKPTLWIAPGWMITGKDAYLEIRGDRHHWYTAGTPLGPLTFESVGRFYVEWGDGTSTGPYDSNGAPWPDGDITHNYRDVGHYDVVVTERWVANWSIGDTVGTVGGLHTEGRIDNFRVEQIQAVVLPG